MGPRPGWEDGPRWQALLHQLVREEPSLLPVCAPPRPSPPTSRGSARLRSRYRRATRLWECTWNSVRVLNEMGGYSSPLVCEDTGEFGCVGVAGCSCGAPLEDGHRDIHARLMQLCRSVVSGRRALPTGVSWRKELLRTELRYEDPDELLDRYEPCQADLVAEPAVHAPTVDMLSLLPSPMREFYGTPERLIRQEREGTEEHLVMNRIYDKVLGPRREFVKYLQRPDAQALWVLGPASDAVATCAVATVWKKDRKALRKILMVCPANYLMHEVQDLTGDDDPYGLRGVGALTAVRSSVPVSLCAGDESNAFSHVMAPVWWRKYMAGSESSSEGSPGVMDQKQNSIERSTKTVLLSVAHGQHTRRFHSYDH